MNTETLETLSRCCFGGYMEGLWLCRRALDGDEPRVLVTPNAEMLSMVKDRKILSGADILFPDGIGIYLAMKRVGLPAAERSCGIGLAERLFESYGARGKKIKVFLLGGRPGVAERAAASLERRYGSADIHGIHHGYFDPKGTENREVIKAINKSGAELILVCMGFPRQERWMLENRRLLTSARLLMGLGGSLDVWSGDVPRAPRAVCELGFEWAYRAIKQPARLARLPSIARFAIETAVTPKETQRN